MFKFLILLPLLASCCMRAEFAAQPRSLNAHAVGEAYEDAVDAAQNAKDYDEYPA